MHVLIYYESTQQSLYDTLSFALSSGLEHSKQINSVSLLKEHYNRDECPILIILSQPTIDIWTELQDLNFTKVLIYIGVRIPKTIRLNNTIFSNEYDFEEKYKASQKDQKSNIIRQYLSYLGPLDEAEQNYLERVFKVPKEIIMVSISRLERASSEKKQVKKGIISVMGTAHEVIDFGRKINQHVRGKVIIVDANLMKPSLDDALKLKSLYSDVRSHLIGIDNTGVNIALDMMAKHIGSEEELLKCTKWIAPNLYVMLGNYNLYNFEHYDDGLIKALVRKLAQVYDMVILHISENPYDVFTMLALHDSDINLIYTPSHISHIRYVNNMLDILNYKQGISREKTLIAASKIKSVKYLHKQVFKKQFVGSNTDKVVCSVLEML